MGLADVFKKYDKKEEVQKEVKIEEPFIEEVKEIKETPKGKILKQFNMIESNIPINHPYWKMR